MRRPDRPDPHATLGVPHDADADTIRRAWRRLAKHTHPDGGGDLATFEMVRAAYDELSDPERRVAYLPPPGGAPSPTVVRHPEPAVSDGSDMLPAPSGDPATQAGFGAAGALLWLAAAVAGLPQTAAATLGGGAPAAAAAAAAAPFVALPVVVVVGASSAVLFAATVLPRLTGRRVRVAVAVTVGCWLAALDLLAAVRPAAAVFAALTLAVAAGLTAAPSGRRAQALRHPPGGRGGCVGRSGRDRSDAGVPHRRSHPWG